MKCPNCGTENPEGVSFCARCGTLLKTEPPQAQPPPSPTDEAVATIIPYRNPYALAAYYLGVFSLIPCIGMLLGAVAVPLGIRGLLHVKRNPGAHGTVHAWVGIVLGGIVFLAHAVVITLMVIASLAGQR